MADPVLEVGLDAAELGPSAELGEVQVDGVGKVRLEARRQDQQLTVRALDPDDKVIGRLTTTVGLSESKIYVNTPEGLQKITVLWGRTE